MAGLVSYCVATRIQGESFEKNFKNLLFNLPRGVSTTDGAHSTVVTRKAPDLELCMRSRLFATEPANALVLQDLCGIESDTAQNVSEPRIGVERPKLRANTDSVDWSGMFGNGAIKPAKGFVFLV